MARPKGNPPRWATDDVYTSGPDNTLPTKVEPLAGEIAQGYQRGGRPPARKLNWLLNSVCEWVGFNIDLNAVNWFPWDSVDAASAVINIDAPRGDGTVRAIYSETHGLWIVPGHNTNGTVYAGEAGYWKLVTTLFPHPIHVVAESLGRVVFFNTDPFLGSPLYCYTDPVTLSAASPVTTAALPVTNPASTHVVTDVVTLNSGRVVAVGAGDSKDFAWYSDDGCVSWVGPIQINAVYISSSPWRVIPGPNNEVLAIGSGTYMWHSVDGGATWTEWTGPDTGFMEGAYLPGFDVWMLTTATATIIRPSPFGLGGYSSIAMPPGSTNTPAGMAAFGDVAVLNIDIAVGTLRHQLFLTRDALAGPMIRIGRNGMAAAQIPISGPVAFASNRAGQFLMATHSYIRTSLRGAA